jgi:hypothetical protein
MVSNVNIILKQIDEEENRVIENIKCLKKRLKEKKSNVDKSISELSFIL